MTNKTLSLHDQKNGNINFLARDNGDGTYSFDSASSASYLGQQVIVGNGANQNATLPSGTKTIWIMSEGGKAHCSVNAVASPTTSGFYCPDGQIRVVGPYDNITTLGVFAPVGTSVHLTYESI
jgi:hypothetical protein